MWSNGTTRSTVATGITVGPNSSVAVKVPVPADGRLLVQLVTPGSTVALRELIFDHTRLSTTGSTG